MGPDTLSYSSYRLISDAFKDPDQQIGGADGQDPGSG